MRMPRSFGLYLVMTDPVVGYEECARIAAGEGVRIIQLRMKHVSQDAIRATAERVKRVLAGSETLFIVNDDVAIAREVDADGLHVGQTDMDLDEVRRHWDACGKILGLSTHGQGQDIAARDKHPDYIGVGPVYATPTKTIPDPAVGVECLVQTVRAAPMPVVAIGGIDRKRLPDVLRAGVRNYAVVRAVCAEPDPARSIRALQRVEREYLSE